jgi:hypothetical protein
MLILTGFISRASRFDPLIESEFPNRPEKADQKSSR